MANEEDTKNLRDPTDEELFKTLSLNPMPQGHKDLGKIIMPFSVDEFWSMFLAPDAPHTFEKLFQYLGFKKIEVT